MTPDKAGYPHYMLKEMYDQPTALRDTISSLLAPTGERTNVDMGITDEQIRSLKKINIVASGASRHAGLAGEFMIERLARIPVEVDHASQYCYRDPIVTHDELTICITQSGTTVDTLAALREAKSKGAKTLAICNVAKSPITQEADGNIFTQAGPEISVAATKSFSTQLAALFVIAVHLGEVRGTIKREQAAGLLREALSLPSKVDYILQRNKRKQEFAELAKIYALASDFMFLGRDICFPIALEGALKLKETCYIHAQGYPTGEFKHGPNALIDYSLPVVMLALYDRNDAASVLRYEKTLSNLRELSERATRLVAVATEGDEEVSKYATDVIYVPHVPVLLEPIVGIVPLQLFAYYVAVRRGVDMDRPRNLSKSVTVE